jgi:dienelactone hydrolase
MSSRVPARQPSLRPAPIGRRTVLLSGLALLAAGCSSAAAPRPAIRPTPRAAPGPQLTLPPPTGSHRLGTTSLHLIDQSRPDPWVPSQRRGLMIQLWYPAQTVEGYPPAPYMTPATARAYEKQQHIPPLNFPVTAGHLGAPVEQTGGGWPVVVYSPGLGGERSETTCFVEDLASHGYVVVTIDHIHDSGVVELPDGQIETVAVPPFTKTDEVPQTVKEISSRAADVSFILDQLTVINRGGNPGHEQRPLPRGLRGALDLGHIGMFGESDGGSTTAHVMHTDPRLGAGIDFDGTLWTPQARAGSDRPLLLFGRQDLDSFEAKTWDTFWKNQRGPRLELKLRGSKHDTFTDFAPLIPQVAPILHRPHSYVVEGIGTISGDRAVAVVRTYISAWFGQYLRHQSSPLLAGPSPHYPEVQFVR